MKKIITIITLTIIIISIVLYSFLNQQTKALNKDETTTFCALYLLRNTGFTVLEQPEEPNNFKVSFLNGADTTLSSYRGQVVILTFWTASCNSSRDKMLSKEIFYQQFKNQGLEILAVNLEDNANTIWQFTRNNHFTFPVLFDFNGSVRESYKIDEYPANFILNRDGKIIAKHTGYFNWDTPEVIAAFESLLLVKPESDAARFAMEFPLIGGDNIFVYRTVNEAADILANGTGVVLLGFQECPWCQLYVVFLQDVTREMGIHRIFYSDIRLDRLDNTEGYQRIVNILSGLSTSNSLQYDHEGKPRVFVPDVTIVNMGRIITRSFMDLNDIHGVTPQEYWNEERVNALKDKLREGMRQIISSCNVC